MTDEATIHISSAVVSVLPDRRDDVLRALAALPDVEIHQRDASKIVIVMEAAGERNPRKPPRRDRILAGRPVRQHGVRAGRAARRYRRLEHVTLATRTIEGTGRRRRRGSRRHDRSRDGAAGRRRYRIAGDQMVEGPLSLLRHRMRGHGGRQGRQGRRHPRRHAGRSQSRAELHQGLFPLQDHVWRRPPDDAASAQEGWRLREGRRTDAGDVGRSLRCDGVPRQGGAEGEGSDRARHVRLGAMDGLRRLRRHQADAGGLSLEQPGSECPPLHGVGGGRLHAHFRHGRADGLLR